MAYFAAYVKPGGKYGRFRATVYIDDGIRAPMAFLFRRDDRNGEVLKSITVAPGETEEVDFDIAGIKFFVLPFCSFAGDGRNEKSAGQNLPG